MKNLDENIQKLLDQIMDFSVSIEKLYQQEIILEENDLLDTEEHKKNQKYLSVCTEAEEEKYKNLFSKNIDSSQVMDYIYIRSMEVDVSDDIVERMVNKINHLSLRKKISTIWKNGEIELSTLDEEKSKEFLSDFYHLLREFCDLSVKYFAFQKIKSTIKKTESYSFRIKLIEKKYQLLFQNFVNLENNSSELSKEMEFLFYVVPTAVRVYLLQYYLEKQAHYCLASLSTVTRAEYEENRADIYYQIYSFAGLISLMSKEQVQQLYALMEMDSKKHKMIPHISRALQHIFKEALTPLDNQTKLNRKRK